MSFVRQRAAGVLISVAICFQPPVAHSQGEDVLARSIALYSTLASYSDTATVVTNRDVAIWSKSTRRFACGGSGRQSAFLG